MTAVSHPRRAHTTGWLGKALLVVASLVATVVAVDVVLLLLYGRVRQVENFYTPDPSYGYKMLPNLEFDYASPYHGYHATVRTNSRGLRGPEIAVPKPAGVQRILLLGDSMTAGLEVGESETFATVCAAHLSGRQPTEVVNSGVRGYNLDNIVGYLTTDGLALDPDVVVYFFTDNDLTTDAEPRPRATDASRGFNIQGVVGRLATWSHLLYRTEILRQQVALRRQRDRAEAARPVFLPGGIVAFATIVDTESIPAFRLTAMRIESLARACADRGIPFVLAGAPQKELVDPETQKFIAERLASRSSHVDFDAIRRWLDDVAGRLGALRYDPVPHFRTGLITDRDYWFHKDNHLNALGHRRLGEDLASWIEAHVPRTAAGSSARTAP